MNFNGQKLHANNFFNNFMNSYAKTIHATFYQSSFKGFLSSPLFFDEDPATTLYTGVTYYKSQDWTQFTELTVASCTFDNIIVKTRGGGIHFVKADSTLTVHGSIFNNCQAIDGGGIFACAQEVETNDNSNQMTHGIMTKFNSQYCCYSFCSAVIDDPNSPQKSGYGSAVLVSAHNINLNYSSTFQCPSKDTYEKTKDAPSYGAQFDLRIKNIDSCNINATSGYSRACSAIEYRDASTGRFQFQTVVDQKGAFITSFTTLTGPVSITECNFVNNTVKYISFNNGPDCAVIHVRMKTVTIENFCFSGITFEGYDDNNKNNRRIVSKGADSNCYFDIIINNCQFDSILSADKDILLSYATHSEDRFTDDIQTNEISNLKLGYCQGKDEPPKIYDTDYFSKSDEFTKTFEFSKSDDFTHSSYFSVSKEFTDSLDFTLSNSFTESANPNPPPPLAKGGGGKPVGAIVGGAVGGVAAVALIAFLIAYFVRKARIQKPVSEEVETLNDSSGPIESKNPLYNNAKDDPFNEDFN